MPMYSYWCPKCDTETEKIAKIAERDEQRCDCGYRLIRCVDAPAAVWAPTAKGGLATT